MGREFSELTSRVSTALLLLPLVASLLLNLIMFGFSLIAAIGTAFLAGPTLAGWWKNYGDWLLPYMQVAAMYVGAGALVHVGVRRLAGALSTFSAISNQSLASRSRTSGF